MESWIFKVIINKSAAKFATGNKFEEPLECIRIGELEIWKYGNMESSHSSRSFNSSLVLTLPGMSEIYLLEKSSCA